MAQAAAAGPTSSRYRKEIGRSHARQGYLWFIIFAVILLLFAIYSAGFFLYAALVVTLLLILSVILASVSIAAVHMSRTLSSRQIPWGGMLEAQLTVENKKELPAFWVFWKDHVDPGLDVQGETCHFKTIGSNGRHQLTFKLHSTKRGFFRIGPAIMESGGPFGLVRRFLVGSSVDFVTVLPRVVPIGKGLSLGQRPIHQVPRRRSIFEDPSRFMGMRDYRPGDSMRRIHWRATARSGTMQVKLFEPSVLTGVLLAVDMSLASYPVTRGKSAPIDRLLELTVTAAASLAEYVLSGDQAVGLISNGIDAASLFPEDWQGGTFQRLAGAMDNADIKEQVSAYLPVDIPPAKGHWQNERIQDGLARLVPGGSIELPDLLITESPRLPRQLVLMIVTPRMDTALTAAVESLKRCGIETGIIWTRLPGQEHIQPEAVPQNVPVYLIRGDSDLQQLGGRSL